jgi:hypothetical protein
MAKQIISNPVIVLAGGTVSSSCRQVTINFEADDVETTNFGGSGWRERIGGLKGGSVDFEWLQDYAAGGIDSVAYALVGSTAAVEVRPAGTAAAGTSSPAFQFNVLVQSWNPVDSAVGDLATVSTSWPITGAITRATA